MLSWLSGKILKNPQLPSNLEELVDPFAKQILRELERNGYTAYLVGGCVRDILLRDRPKDFDIATNASPSQVRRLIPGSFVIGRRFKIVLVRRHRKLISWSQNRLFPPEAFQGELEFEVTTFRGNPVVEADQVNENVFGTPELDAKRRDFTVNGMFLSLSKKKVIDHVGGLSDLKKGVLRVIGDPVERFREDPVRIIRALRFVAKTKLKPERKTDTAIRESVPLLSEAKPERVRHEIIKIIREGKCHTTFELFARYGVWDVISPLMKKVLNDTNRRDRFFRFAQCLDREPWPNMKDLSPVFFALSEALQIHGKEHEQFVNDFRIFKTELEAFTKLKSQIYPSHIEKTIHFLSRRDDRSFIHQMGLCYVLWCLSQIDKNKYDHSWQQLLPHWQHLLSRIPRGNSPHVPASKREVGPSASRARRPRRRRRPHRGSGELGVSNASKLSTQ